MLDPEKVAAVKRLVAEGGRPQRKIARMVGVSRGSVQAIATGRRPDYETHRLAEKRLQEAAEVLGTSPPERCPDCGGMACMPCRACHLKATHNVASTPPEPGNLSTLELRPADRKRYYEIRRLRQTNGVTND